MSQMNPKEFSTTLHTQFIYLTLPVTPFKQDKKQLKSNQAQAVNKFQLQVIPQSYCPESYKSRALFIERVTSTLSKLIRISQQMKRTFS